MPKDPSRAAPSETPEETDIETLATLAANLNTQKTENISERNTLKESNDSDTTDVQETFYLIRSRDTPEDIFNLSESFDSVVIFKDSPIGTITALKKKPLISSAHIFSGVKALQIIALPPTILSVNFVGDVSPRILNALNTKLDIWCISFSMTNELTDKHIKILPTTISALYVLESTPIKKIRKALNDKPSIHSAILGPSATGDQTHALPPTIWIAFISFETPLEALSSLLHIKVIIILNGYLTKKQYQAIPPGKTIVIPPATLQYTRKQFGERSKLFTFTPCNMFRFPTPKKNDIFSEVRLNYKR